MAQCITIWSVSLQECLDISLLAQYEGLLSQDERKRWTQFMFEKDRHCYLVSRALLRTVLANILAVHPSEVCFGKSSKGKPFLTHPKGGELSFNLTHCEDMVLLAVANRGQIGIDVEPSTRSAPLDIAYQYFAEHEVRSLKACAPKLRDEYFFALWTLKESYVKATGQGLSTPLHSFGFSFDRAKEIVLSGDSAWSVNPNNWCFTQWRASPTHIAALCIERANQAIYPALCFHRSIPLVCDDIFTPLLERTSPNYPVELLLPTCREV
ncbi:MAG: 4'-phosphopantetheinyl transferase superfamily protein [Burkholderiales bacterium]|nr:4'-phosphopantetheinyl transferase superfamily protein [Burkholderiales bacterium]